MRCIWPSCSNTTACSRLPKSPSSLFWGKVTISRSHLISSVYSFSLSKSHVIGEIQFDALLVSTLTQMAPSDVSLALPYVLLLGRLPHPAFKDLTHVFLERLVIDTKQYDVLLGHIKPNEQFEVRSVCYLFSSLGRTSRGIRGLASG